MSYTTWFWSLIMSPVTGHHFPIHKACPNHFWRSPHIYQFLLTRNFSGLSDKLHQSHRVKEIHHLTHHGKVTSQCYLTLFEVCIINMLCIFSERNVWPTRVPMCCMHVLMQMTDKPTASRGEKMRPVSVSHGKQSNYVLRQMEAVLHQTPGHE